MVISIESNDNELVENILNENGIDFEQHITLFDGYFNLICEGAFENLLQFNNELQELDIELKNKIISDTAEQLKQDEHDLYYLLFKSQEIIEKKLLKIDFNEYISKSNEDLEQCINLSTERQIRRN